MSISPKRLRSNTTAPRRQGRIRTADQLYRELAHAVPDLSEGLPAFIASNAVDAIEQPPIGVGIPNTVFVNMKGVAERVAVKHSVLIDARALSEGMPVLVKARRDGFLWIRDINASEADRAFQTSLPLPNLTMLNHDHESNDQGGTLDAAAIASGTLILERGGTESNLGSTGGANQFLKQSSAGAAVTVGTIGASDITTALTTPPAIGGTTPAAGKFTTLENTGAYVHNEAGGNVDARWEGDTDANLLFLDASADNLGVGTSTPNGAAKLHVVTTTKGTVVYPVMTTAQRTAISSPIEGLGVYDSDENALFLHDGSTWVEVGSGGGGAADFTDLGDVPAAYTGAAGKYVAVNSGETALEFVTPVGSGGPIATTDTFWLGKVIQDTTLGSAGRFDYSSIPTGYKMLQFIFRIRSSVTATSDTTRFYINGETSANDAKYHMQASTGNNAASDFSETANPNLAASSAASSPTSGFGYVYVYVTDYDSTSYRKIFRIENHVEFADGVNYVSKRTMVWEDTAAINQIQFQPDGYATDNFAIGSQMTVIGWKEQTIVTDISGAGLTVNTANVSNPPTDAELDSAFGTPATVGTGFYAAVNDNNAGTNVYLVLSDGTSWWFNAMTKAT